jgi:hypothetical protein
LELDQSPFGQRRQRLAKPPESTQLDPGSADLSSPVAVLPPSLAVDDFESQTIAAEIKRIRRRFDVPMSDASNADIPMPHFDRMTTASQASRRVARPNVADDAKSPAARAASPRVRRRSSSLAWMALAFGLMAFVCGAMLLGWSLVAGRSELWNVGLPIALVGQFALLFGLIWQLDGLWQGNRDAADKLDDVDGRLDDLKKTATLLTTAHSSPAQAFYVHMASGAGPQLLLADLKGQLDLLALQMADERR